MKTYQFPKQNLAPVIDHIASYQITILSLTPQADNYIMELDTSELPLGEYEHLADQYSLEEII